MNIKQDIEQVLTGQDLTEDQARVTMTAVMDGKVNECQLASFLTALRAKGESIPEVTGFAKAMREKGVAVYSDQPVMDIVGTGGDEAKTFNISTTACFVLAAMGIPMAKHGGRSVSSKSGAADVLEALGANIELGKAEAEQVLAETGMCFFFAPVYHSSMRHAAPVRKAMGMRTVFNILGPLASPIRAKREVMGVYSRELVEPMAQVLLNLGLERGAVIHGDDGLDEVTLTTTTTAAIIKDGKYEIKTIDPRDYDLSLCQPEDLQGGEAEENAKITKAVLNAARGPKRDVVVLNAALGAMVNDPSLSMKEAVFKVQACIDSGLAYKQLKKFIKATQEIGMKAAQVKEAAL